MTTLFDNQQHTINLNTSDTNSDPIDNMNINEGI